MQKLVLTGLAQYTGVRGDVYFDATLGPYGALNSHSVEAYSLASFEASYEFNRHLSLCGRMENVFDTQYQEIYGFSTRGRGVYLKLTARW